MLRLLEITALLLGGAAAAQEKPLAFKGATIITISGAVIENGVLVVQDGKITAVGASDVAVPAGAEVRDVAGKVIMPGLVDTHSHIDIDGGADQSAPIQAEVRIMDSINAPRLVASRLSTLCPAPAI